MIRSHLSFALATALATVILTVSSCGPDTISAPQVQLQAAKSPRTSPNAHLTDGFTTPAPQPVTIVADNRFKLELHSDQAVFRSTIDLANTVAAGTIDCVTDPVGALEDRKAALLLKLRDAEQNRFFNAYIDRRSIGGVSDQHRVAHTWNEPNGGLFTLRIGANTLLPGVNASAAEVGRDVFRFTGGAVLIADRSGAVADHLWMACINRDEVTVTLKR